jgi:hypothetical protein
MTAPKVSANALLGASVCCLAVAAQASAAPRGRLHATSQEVSDNWAGYVVTAHKPFRRVIGAWVQPKVTCAGAPHRYSAFWVGIGGFTKDAQGLEQVGTEADCSGGHSSSYAWYELLPAGEVSVPLKVHSGDRMAASVTINGAVVALHLHDLSTGASYGKQVRTSSPDTSSAEWIAEAPSVCASGSTNCQTLPLADFSRVTFSGATAATRGGGMSPVDSPSFHVTAVRLEASGVRLGIPGRAIISSSSAQATPGALAKSGSSFTVTWEPGQSLMVSPPPLPAGPPVAPARAVSAQ